MKHGGDLSGAVRRYGGPIGAWLDLSSGINPWPYPVPADLPSAAWQRLPARADEEALIAAACEAYQIPDGVAVVPAPGTQSLIQWLPHLVPPGEVAVVGPTYGEHAAAWSGGGHQVIEIDALERLPASAHCAIVVNPNNPDGRATDRDIIAQAGAQLRGRDGLLVIDESFADLDPSHSSCALCNELPVVVLRSFGKFYGLAGLRLGFMIASPEISAPAAKALGPWAVSGPALAIGCSALGDRAWAEATRRRIAAQAERLDAVLASGGLAAAGGTGLFRLVRHPAAAAIHDGLAKQKIWSRRFDWAPELLRFGLPPDDAGLERLAAALRQQ